MTFSNLLVHPGAAEPATLGPTPPPAQSRSTMTRSANRYHLLRHGESTANRRCVIASRPENALESYGLTPRGRAQVHDAVSSALVSGALEGTCRVVSSPLLRARQSAQIAAGLLRARGGVEIDGRLTERGFGSLELAPDDQYRRVWSADAEDPGHESWGVESIASVLARAKELIRELEAKRPTDVIVLCTHGDVASALLCDALGLPLERHRDVGALANAELRELASARRALGS